MACLISLLFCTICNAQSQSIDSLSRVLNSTQDIVQQTNLLNQIAFIITFSDPQKSYEYAKRAEHLADSLGLASIKADALARMGIILYRQGSSNEALEKLFEAVKVYSSLSDTLNLSKTENLIGNAYLHFKSYDKSIEHYKLSVSIARTIDDQTRICVGLKNIGRAYNRSNQPETALLYLRQALAVCEVDTTTSGAYTSLLSILGSTYHKLGKHQDAIKYLTQVFRVASRENQSFFASDVGLQLAEVYLQSNRLEMAEFYARKSEQIAQQAQAKTYLSRAYRTFYLIRKKQKRASEALHYLELHKNFQDSVFNTTRLAEISQLSENFTLYKQEKENELLKNKQKLHTEELRNRELIIWATSGGFALAILLAYFFFRGKSRHKQAKELLSTQNYKLLASEEKLRKQKEEALATNERLEKAMTQLREAQNKLVEAGKVAAMGQLTANIAHEINNPLGAVQSASNHIHKVLSSSLPRLQHFFSKLDEHTQNLFWKQYLLSTKDTPVKFSTKEVRILKKEIGNKLAAMGISGGRKVNESIALLRGNANWEYLEHLLKHPLKDDIFLQLNLLLTLQHSNQTIIQAVNQASKAMHTLKAYTATTDKAPQEINLAQNIEEALSLYKNKMSDEIILEKVLTPNLPPVIGYPEELRQVWANLIVNALQAMEYKGLLSIGLKKHHHQLIVSVQDSGKGIEPDIQGEIFKPFFTTKPNGEGSGLGLDIVKKIIENHHGEVKLTSELGKGSTFEVILPIKPS